MSDGAFPLTICAWCPECGFRTLHDLIAEHGPYLVYECRRCGRALLVPMGEVSKFTNLESCIRG